MEEHGKEVAFQFPPLFYLYTDGSVGRSEPPSPEASPEDPITFKDLTFNAERGLWARIYLPNPPPPLHKKLPVVLFFHGGGFVMGSPAWDHQICSALASQSGLLWISCSYRLAPEHRLPAALNDGIAALEWLWSQAVGGSVRMDPWLAQYADFSKCFLVGESVGGIIIHHVAMHAALKKPSSWLPLCVRGLVHIHPCFMRGIAQRTEEEKAMESDVLFNWCHGDLYFDLTLPGGASSKEDHPFFYPMPELAACAGKAELPKALVAVAEKDCLQFMGREFCKSLKNAGCEVEVLMSPGVGHCFYYIQPESEQANLLFHKIVSFLHEQC